VVDTLAGAIFRVFARLNEIERAYNDFWARVGVVEDRTPARPAPANDSRRTMTDGRLDTSRSNPASRDEQRQARPRSAAGWSNWRNCNQIAQPKRLTTQKGEGGHGQPPVLMMIREKPREHAIFAATSPSNGTARPSDDETSRRSRRG
jgi:hypothetical protein